MTIRQLLTHTSGIGELRRWSDLLRPTAALTVKRGRPLPDLADYYAPRLRPEAVPGTKWAYANHGFGVLGQLIADVRGEPFPQVMRREIFAPLQMDRTDFLRGERVDDRLAVGYRLRRGRLKPVNDRDVTVLPAGSCFSCLDDLMRYVSALVVGGAPLLRPGTLEQMLTPQGEPDARLPAMGLCFFLDRFGDHRVAGHDGSGLGFGSAMLFAPDDGVGVIAFTNTAVALAPQLLANRVLRRLLDVHESAVPRAPERPHHWSELAGVYKPPPGLNTNLRWWPLIGGEVEVTVRGGHLLARAPSLLKPLRKGVRLHAADADDPLLFVVRQADFAAPVAFVRGPDGRVCSLRTGSILGGFLRLERRPRATSLRLWGRVAGIGTLLGLGVRVARMRARPGPQRRFFR